MSTRRNTAANELVPQTNPEAIIRQANAEKRRIKASVEQHLLDLATGAIKPTSDTFDPDFLTSKYLLTDTSNPPTNRPETAWPATSSSSSTNITRHPTPPQPTFNSQDPPSPMSDSNPKEDGKLPSEPESNAPPSMEDFLKALLATQQATMAQAQADREEYNRRLARQDTDAANRLAKSASRITRLEEAMIGMAIKPQTPERQSQPPSDDVNLRTFRMADGPAYTGPYQEVEPFLLWLNSLDMFFRSKDITNERTMIILTGGFIKEANLLGFFATDSKRLLDGTWATFRIELMATALLARWQTVIQKQFHFFKITTSESFPQFVARGRSLQLMLNFERATVTDRDLAESITFGLPEAVKSDIYKLRLLEEAPFVFSEFVARATDSYNTTSPPHQRPRGTGATSSTQHDTPFLPQDDYVWRIHSYLDSIGKCHYCKQHCGSAHGTCPGPVDRLRVPIPPSFVAPPKPTNYVAPTAWTKTQAASGKAPPPHLPAGRQTSRPAGVAGISDEEMWPEYDHISEVALDAIDAQATICETLALDKICAADDKALLAEFGDLSFPPTVLANEERRFPEDTAGTDRYASVLPPPFLPCAPALIASAYPATLSQRRSVIFSADQTNHGDERM
ncbi:hypothetical protein PSTT_12363 [Puccinia striiformis]|uniref:Uncharacterized protein n=1 Tax=Puccinia striiformis TaxID=27350 RepID=A0A2S4UWF0_9BASI|nr:hypothetical protein PSTT_12363 [Puccinia striiformis]